MYPVNSGEGTLSPRSEPAEQQPKKSSIAAALSTIRNTSTSAPITQRLKPLEYSSSSGDAEKETSKLVTFEEQANASPSQTNKSSSTLLSYIKGISRATNQNTFNEALDHFRSVWDRAKTQISLFNDYEVTGKEEWTAAWNTAKSACDTKKLTHRQDIIKITGDAANAAEWAVMAAARAERAVMAVMAERAVIAAARAVMAAARAERAAARAERAAARAAARTERAAKIAMAKKVAMADIRVERATAMAAARAPERTAEQAWNAAENAWNAAWDVMVIKERHKKNTFLSRSDLNQTTKPQPSTHSEPPSQDPTKKHSGSTEQLPKRPSRDLAQYPLETKSAGGHRLAKPGVSTNIWDYQPPQRSATSLSSTEQNSPVVKYRNLHRGLSYSHDEQVVEIFKRDNLNEMLVTLAQSGHRLKLASGQQKNNPVAVLVAVWSAPAALQYASEPCQNNPRIVLTAVSKQPSTARFASEQFKNNSFLTRAAETGQPRDIAAFYEHTANSFEQKGLHCQSLSSREELLEMQCKMFGNNHLLVAHTLSRCGYNSYHAHQYEKSLAYYEAAANVYSGLLGTRDINRANNLTRAANSLGQMGRYKRALQYHKKSLKITESLFGEKHLKTAMCLSNVGNSFIYLGFSATALAYLKQSLRITKSLCGKKERSLIFIWSQMGRALDSLGKYEKAHKYKTLAINLAESLLGKKHLDYATCVSNIACNLEKARKQGRGGAANMPAFHLDVKEAIQLQLNSLKLFKEQLDPIHPLIATELNNIGNSFLLIKDMSAALKNLKESLEIKEKLFGKNHPSYAETLRSLAACDDESATVDLFEIN